MSQDTQPNLTPPEPPAEIQVEQRCAWCGQYLLMGEETELYNGPAKRYHEWICHRDCNIKKNDFLE